MDTTFPVNHHFAFVEELSLSEVVAALGRLGVGGEAGHSPNPSNVSWTRLQCHNPSEG